jgi:hypothetical protein
MKHLIIGLLAALLFLITKSSFALDPLFYSRLDFWVGDAPCAVIAADLDGDGDNDLAITNQTDCVSVLINDGQGMFCGPINYQVGDDPRSIAAADFDRDGDQDLATANRAADNISILFNNGDATFQDSVAYTVGDNPISIFTADIDGDNDNDLLVANEYSNNVSVLINNNDGTFQSAVYYEVGEECTSIYAADLDGDNDNDLVVAGEENVIIFFNIGNGTFQDSTLCSFGYDPPQAVCAADLDNDGDHDLAVVSRCIPFQLGNISIVMNNGDGTFQEPEYLGGSGFSVFTIDLDGDNDIDIVAGDYYVGIDYGYQCIVLNNGDGTFQAPLVYNSPGTSGLFAADLNGDGDNDLVTAGKKFAPIFINNGDATFHEPDNYEVGENARSVIADDLDGDGDNDMAVATYRRSPDYAGYVSVFLNNGDGTYQDSINYSTEPETYSVFAADLDGDGDQDLATANSLEPPDNVSILLNNGDGTFQETINYTAGTRPNSIYAADFDNDGDNDLALTNSVSNDVSILFNNGNATFQGAINYGNVGEPKSVLSADLNNDNFYDLAVADGDGISILLGNGDGTFQQPVHFDAGSQPNSWCNSVFIADLNGDDFQDLVAGHVMSNEISILFNNGNGSFQDAVNYEAGENVYSVFATDIDADGDFDVLAANNGSCNVMLFLNDGYGMLDRQLSYGVPNPPVSVFAADLDGDGDSDLAVTNSLYSDRHLSILKNLSNTTNVDHEELPMPESFFSCSYPNPFNISTAISYDLPYQSQVTIEIYNILGRRVTTFRCGMKPAGYHQTLWNADDLSSGIYFYRIQAGEYTETRKIVLLK